MRRKWRTRARNSLYFKISRLKGTKKDKKLSTCTKESDPEDDVITTASGISVRAHRGSAKSRNITTEYYSGILLWNITLEYYFRKWREDGVCTSKHFRSNSLVISTKRVCTEPWLHNPHSCKMHLQGTPLLPRVTNR